MEQPQGTVGCQLQSTLWNCWCWELCNFMISKYSENLQMSIWGISGHENTGSVPAAGFFWVAKCWGAVAAHLFTYLLSHQSVCYLAGDLVSEAADSVWCVLAVRWTTFDSTPNIKHTHTPRQSILTDNPGSCKKATQTVCVYGQVFKARALDKLDKKCPKSSKTAAVELSLFRWPLILLYCLTNSIKMTDQHTHTFHISHITNQSLLPLALKYPRIPRHYANVFTIIAI